jgi:hypothetical protein
MACYVERTSIGPVTALRSDGFPRRYAAGLTFGVGRFDETLASSGITRLVAHLAMGQLNAARRSFSARVRGRFTEFTMETTDPADVTDYVTAVCRGLSEDHRDRLKAEKSVLLGRETASWGGGGSVGLCLATRFGAAGPGLLYYPEYGLHRLDWEEVEHWRQRWFTAGNVVMWVRGPLSPEIRLGLPDGQSRMVPDAPQPRDISLPGYVISGTSDLGIAMTGTESLAVRAAVQILAHRLRDSLTYRSGVSYGVHEDLEWLGPGLSLAQIRTDTVDNDHVISAEDRVLESFDLLIRQGPTPKEITDYRRHLQDKLGSPEGSAPGLARLARRILTTDPGTASPDLQTEPHAVDGLDGQAILAAAAALFAQAIFAVPDAVPNSDVPVAERMPRLPQWSAEASQIQGTQFRAPSDPSGPGPRRRRLSLTAGSEGVMLTSSATPDQRTVVRYHDIAAQVRWNDGRRLLIGADGLTIKFNPAHWPGAATIGAMIDSGVPQFRTVDIDSPAPPDWVPPDQLLTMAYVNQQTASRVLGLVAWLGFAGGLRVLLSGYYVVGSTFVAIGIASFIFARRYLGRRSRWTKR